jgi:hypothetical protein
MPRRRARTAFSAAALAAASAALASFRAWIIPAVRQRQPHARTISCNPAPAFWTHAIATAAHALSPITHPWPV